LPCLLRPATPALRGSPQREKKASQRASPAGLIRCPSGMAFESFAPPFSFSFSFRFDRQLRARA
jgi:hypothetical protein